MSITGVQHEGGPVWWVITPDRDVYPEELQINSSIVGMVGCDFEGILVNTSWVGRAEHLDQVHDFLSQNAIVHPSEFVDIERSVNEEVNKRAEAVKQELAILAAAFSRYDGAGRGSLSAAELKRALDDLQLPAGEL